MERERTTTVEKRKRVLVMLAEVRRLTKEIAREEVFCEHLYLDANASPRICISCGKIEAN